MWKGTICVCLAVCCVAVLDAKPQSGGVPFYGAIPEEKIRAAAPEGDGGPNDVYPVRSRSLKKGQVVVYPNVINSEYGKDPERSIYEIVDAKEFEARNGPSPAEEKKRKMMMLAAAKKNRGRTQESVSASRPKSNVSRPKSLNGPQAPAQPVNQLSRSFRPSQPDNRPPPPPVFPPRPRQSSYTPPPPQRSYNSPHNSYGQPPRG